MRQTYNKSVYLIIIINYERHGPLCVYKILLGISTKDYSDHFFFVGRICAFMFLGLGMAGLVIFYYFQCFQYIIILYISNYFIALSSTISYIWTADTYKAGEGFEKYVDALRYKINLALTIKVTDIVFKKTIVQIGTCRSLGTPLNTVLFI